MIAQKLRTPTVTLFLDRLEHVNQIERVVSGARHQLHAQQVRLLLVLATVTQKVGAQAKLGALRDDLADIAGRYARTVRSRPGPPVRKKNIV
jgi:hypothetical protein